MKTRVINTSGEDAKVFAFLPPHGQTLDSNSSVDIEGDLRTVLGSGRARYSRNREIAALDAACADVLLIEQQLVVSFIQIAILPRGPLVAVRSLTCDVYGAFNG